MAVDSMAKRASATLFMNPSQAKGVVPGGAVDQADRQDVVWMYRGILATAAGVNAPTAVFYGPLVGPTGGPIG